MESMDLAAACKLKDLALSPLSPMERELGAFEALLDVLEAGIFTDPEIAAVLEQTARVIGGRKHLEIFSGRIALLIERAQQRFQPFKLVGP